ncbi:hypothetical protein J6590_035329 [Homalodisca vitripennis]|nr:hypothetical protein J6590_035329 [Homalodisca vitripennis]
MCNVKFFKIKVFSSRLNEDKREERDRVLRVGDWSEHLSSSGKKYYYNCKTEVSQWEKPREWVERSRPVPAHPLTPTYNSGSSRTGTVIP